MHVLEIIDEVLVLEDSQLEGLEPDSIGLVAAFQLAIEKGARLVL